MWPNRLLRALSGVSFCALAAAPAPAQLTANTSGGELIPEQAAYDVLHYDLALEVRPVERTIEGVLTVRARVVEPMKTLVLDLDTALAVRRATLDGKELRVERRGGRVRIALPRRHEAGEELAVAVAYGGEPRVAPRPPWQGGFTWSRTKDGRPWIATSCQHEGADLWWPCKDHPSDEPDTMDLHITVPEGLVVASNGRLVGVEDRAGGGDDEHARTFHWHVSTPINNYGVALNIAPYVEIKADFESVAGDTFPVSFWVLPENEEKGRALFPEFLDHLRFFEELFGPYPFRADKYGVAETPHLGMEHQTIIAYGYGYQRHKWGYDWLHHHEASHEWWANLVTAPDWNDFWIHEGIGTYSQALYVERLHDLGAYFEEMQANRRRIRNERAVAPRGPKTTNEISFGSDNDVYFKGAWTLHALRWVIGKEALLRSLRRLAYPTPELERETGGAQCRFATTDEFLALLEKESGRELGWLFDVYLRQPELPRLETARRGTRLTLEWKTPGRLPFPMPVEIEVGGELRRIELPAGKASVDVGRGEVRVDPRGWVLREGME